MKKHRLSVCLVCLLAGTAARAVDRPNIMVFLVDDMGVMDTSVPFLTDEAGQPKRYPLNDYYRTPSMERLARHGIRFNQFYAMSVCSPTRISIMTGQNAARHRATNWINPRQNNAGSHRRRFTSADIVDRRGRSPTPRTVLDALSPRPASQ
jgi:arylsulfatase A-like enzyme